MVKNAGRTTTILDKVSAKYYWTGVAQVRIACKSGNRKRIQHGYTAVLGFAKTYRNFRAKIKIMLHNDGIKLVRITELFSYRAASEIKGLPKDMSVRLKLIQAEGQVDYGDVHTYPS